MKRFDARSLTTAVLAAAFLSNSGCMRPLLRPDELIGGGLATNRLRSAAGDELTPRETAEACLATARALDRAGHVREAITLYEKARQQNSTLKHVARRLAVLYDQAEDPVRSQAEFQLALKESPRDPSLLSDYGHFHYRHGRAEEAERWLRKALEMEENHPSATTNLAVLLAERGELEQSLALFSKIVGPAAANSNLGVILAKSGEPEEAKRYFERSRSLDPGLRQPKAFLAYLEQAAKPPAVADADA